MSNGFDLGASAISSLGGIAGMLIGSALSSHAAGKQFKYNAWLQKQAARLNLNNSKAISSYNAKLNTVIPSYNRKGLEKAGYNPLLAVQNGTSGANAGSVAGTGTPGVDAPDYSGGISAGLSNAFEFQRLSNESKQAEAIADNQYSQADKNKVEKQSMLQKLPFVSDREKAEIGNIEKDTLMKESQIHNIDETTRFIEKDFELRKKLGEMGIDVQRQGNILGYNGVVYNANAMKEIADKHSPSGQSTSFHNYTSGVSDVLRSIGGYLPWYNNENTYTVGSDGQVKGSKHKQTKKSRRK